VLIIRINWEEGLNRAGIVSGVLILIAILLFGF